MTRWLKPAKDTKRRCAHCERFVLKGQFYQRAANLPGWEHYTCWQKSRDKDRTTPPEPPAARRTGFAFARALYGVHDEDKNLATGRGVNFPGLTVEWQWVEPEDWPPYRLHVAGLAYRRRIFDHALGPERSEALQHIALRLMDKILSPDDLAAACRDAEGEFDLPTGLCGYWLAALGIILLGREWVEESAVAAVERVDAALIEKILRSRR